MEKLERQQRLFEIPRLVAIEHRRLAEIGEKIERLEAERKERLALVLELQREELALLRRG